MKPFFYLLFIAIMTLSSMAASAATAESSPETLHLIISGRSLHFDGLEDWNENNYGLGFEYDFSSDNKTIPFLSGASFKDSHRDTTKYLGGGYKYRALGKNSGLHLDLGLFMGAATRRDHKDNHPFFVALPFMSVGNDYIAINATLYLSRYFD